VRCPKCQAPLPAAGKRVSAVTPGGTAVVARGFPLVPVLIGGGVALAVILVFALRDGDEPRDKRAGATPTPTPEEASTVEPQPAPAAGASIAPTDTARRTDGNTVDPYAVGRDVERALRRQRLWATVEVVGKTIDVRSGSCRDPNMAPFLDAARTALRNAGLTRLRCLEQSGAVVFEHEL